MATELLLMRGPGRILLPTDEHAEEYIGKLKAGQWVRAEVKKVRNYKFLQKYMVMMRFAFDHWEPREQTYLGQVVAKDFDQFRRDVTILAGFYEAAYRVDGTVVMTAKSISFANMEEGEFDRVYNESLNVILAKVLRSYSRAQLDEVVDRLLQFA